MKNKMDGPGETVPGPRLIRYPDVYSPNAQTTLLSLVPALAKKCVQYASTPELFIKNATTVHQELIAKGYPRAMWENKFKHGLLNHTRNTPYRTHTGQLLSLFTRAST